MHLLLNVLVFNVWHLKEENVKKEEGAKRLLTLYISLEITSARGGETSAIIGEVKQWLPTSLHLSDQKQQSEDWSPVFRGQSFYLPTLAPARLWPPAPEKLEELPLCGWSRYCINSWNLLQSTIPASFWKLEDLNRLDLQNSYIGFCQCNCYLSWEVPGEGFSFCHLLRILLHFKSDLFRLMNWVISVTGNRFKINVAWRP